MSAHLRLVTAAPEAPAEDVWFADLEAGLTGGAYVRDTVQAKALRRCFRELAGVKASVTVKRYSMATGLDLRGPYGVWTDDEAQRIATVFPSLVSTDGRFNEARGCYALVYRVADWIHPSRRDDGTDLQADHFDPGGFTVAAEHLLAVAAIVSEEIERAAK